MTTGGQAQPPHMESDRRLPDIADIEDAARRLVGVVVETPLLESDTLNDRLGGRLLVKAESLQRTGSFKLRGAFNRICRLTHAERRRGVVGYSSGNHAQGVAAAAALVGVPALIVMPADAPAAKIAGTRNRGAEVVLYDRETQSREAIAERLAAERGAVLVRPYDDPDVIAGQGTVGIEVAAQAARLGAEVDVVLAPCSGGGLTAGIAIAFAVKSPTTSVMPVEPAGFNDTARSLAAGHRVGILPGGRTLCDALQAAEPGALTFAINRRLIGRGLAVDDLQTAAAVAAAFHHFKLVVEPSGAVALAAALFGAVEVRGRTVAVICSGGNVDADAFVRILAEANSGGQEMDPPRRDEGGLHDQIRRRRVEEN